MVTTPTRNQLERLVDGDERLLRALESLFEAVADPDTLDLTEIEAAIAGLQQSPSAASVAMLGGKQDVVAALGDTFIFVTNKYDFPAAVSGVITLNDNVTYFVTTTVDLEGDRIVGGQNSVLMGSSPENCKIISTGLIGTALLTSIYALPMSNIDITADVGVYLDGPGLSLDWTGVNFVNCPVIGTIANYDNFIGSTLGFINSANLTFDGTFGTIGMDNSIFVGISGQTSVILPSTMTITRRFRITYSAFVVLGTSLDVDVTATIPIDGYILDTCNFGGPGTTLVGVQHDDNKALFMNNVGEGNSADVSNYHMVNNATATVITTVDTPVKALGTTISNPITQRFTNTDNRAEYIGAVTEDFTMLVTASLVASNNVEMAMYVAVNGVFLPESISKGTGNAGGRADGMSSIAIAELTANDYVEVWVENQSGTQNITVENLNVIVEAM